MGGKQALLSLLLAGIGSAVAAPCPTASLLAYQSLGAAGCTVGALSFSSFAVAAFPGPTATQIAPGSVIVAPVANGLALSAAAPLSASAGTLLGLRFTFGVGASSLVGGTVALGTPASVSGDGVVTALLDAGAAGHAIAIAIDGFADTPASFASASMPSYAGFLELGIDAGTFGAASLGPTLATLTFTAAPIPEPAPAGLSLLGLSALWAIRRRFRMQP